MPSMDSYRDIHLMYHALVIGIEKVSQARDPEYSNKVRIENYNSYHKAVRTRPIQAFIE